MKLVPTIRIACSVLLVFGAIAVRFAPHQVDQILSLFESGSHKASGHYTLVPGGIVNGDTLRVRNGHKELQVRLCGIDAPEKDQAKGLESRDHLRQLMAQGTGRVTLVATDTDVYGRTVAEVFIPTGDNDEEINLNAQMVADGMAYVYPKYVGSCPNGGRMQVAESDAKRLALGVWALPNPEKPWDYRASRP